MFSLPTAPESGANVEGTSDEHPNFLPQVTIKEFTQFLWVFYNLYVSYFILSFSLLKVCRKSFENKTSAERWKTFRLAHMSQCDAIRERAFHRIDCLPISLVGRAVLTTLHDASAELLEKALVQLSARSQPLPIDQGRQLAIERTL